MASRSCRTPSCCNLEGKAKIRLGLGLGTGFVVQNIIPKPLIILAKPEPHAGHTIVSHCFISIKLHFTFHVLYSILSPTTSREREKVPTVF